MSLKIRLFEIIKPRRLLKAAALIALFLGSLVLTGMDDVLSPAEYGMRQLQEAPAALDTQLELATKVPYFTRQVLSAEVNRGVSKKVQPGVTGLIHKKYGVYYEDGSLRIGDAPTETVLRVMQPEITAIGVKDTPLLSSRDMSEPKAVLAMEATAYTHTGNPTFTGVYPQVGAIAVDPRVIPLGTRMWVEGYGYGIAQDTGGLIKGHIIDVFMDTEAECRHWGRRQVKVYILE
ncbi:MAG: 3D domain-containing protein [Clostridia bacterium]|jgi:3D (Asp-Asp-Asp) domain-containing protein|nr:3D domain-containing protein [Clostridia bacterium]